MCLYKFVEKAPNKTTCRFSEGGTLFSLCSAVAALCNFLERRKEEIIRNYCSYWSKDDAFHFLCHRTIFLPGKSCHTPGVKCLAARLRLNQWSAKTFFFGYTCLLRKIKKTSCVSWMSQLKLLYCQDFFCLEQEVHSESFNVSCVSLYSLIWSPLITFVHCNKNV